MTALVLEMPPLELPPGALLDLGERRLREGEEAKASLAVAFSLRVCFAFIQSTRVSAGNVETERYLLAFFFLRCTERHVGGAY